MEKELEIKDLKAQAYDIYVQIQFHQVEIDKLKQQIIEVNNRLQKELDN